MSESVLCGVHREEKTEQLMDSKHEAERLEQELQRFKQEVSIFSFFSINVRPSEAWDAPCTRCHGCFADYAVENDERNSWLHYSTVMLSNIY